MARKKKSNVIPLSVESLHRNPYAQFNSFTNSLRDPYDGMKVFGTYKSVPVYGMVPELVTPKNKAHIVKTQKEFKRTGSKIEKERESRKQKLDEIRTYREGVKRGVFQTDDPDYSAKRAYKSRDVKLLRPSEMDKISSEYHRKSLDSNTSEAFIRGPLERVGGLKNFIPTEYNKNLAKMELEVGKMVRISEGPLNRKMGKGLLGIGALLATKWLEKKQESEL